MRDAWIEIVSKDKLKTAPGLVGDPLHVVPADVAFTTKGRCLVYGPWKTGVLASLVLLAMTIATSLFAGFSGTDLFLPSVGRRPGLEGSQWYTVVWIHNPTSSVANVTIRFLERDRPNPSPLFVDDVIPAGHTKRYDNILTNVFHLEKWGALQITATTGVLVMCRMYNQPPGGDERDTQGQAYNGIPATFAIGTGQSTQILGVYQTDPKSDSQFRYNFGFVETTGNPVNVRVLARDEYGTIVATKDYPPVGPYEPRYYPIEDLVPGVNATNLRLEAQVTGGSGRIIAVGSGVANRSNDATTFEMAFRDELLGGSSTGLTSVFHDGTLVGDGTTFAPLGIVNGGVTKDKLSAGGGSYGQVLGTDGSNLEWQYPTGGGFSLPFSGSTSEGLTALRVEQTMTTGDAVAIYGQIRSTAGVGVWGATIATGGTTFGVTGSAASPDGVGVAGMNSSLYGDSAGVFGVASSPSGTGVLGYCDAKTGKSLGVGAGVDSSDGTAVLGAAYSTYGTSVGVYGYTKSTSGYAGYFEGSARVTGYLYKSGGGFQIDHPLDPANKYLNHSFVESADMKNVYDGVVVLDEDGQATVDLPGWFEALNRDFRYQLTCVGAFAPIFVAKEVSGNSFAIAGGNPGLKVSWQITGIRKDSWANSHRLPVEQEKSEKEKGQYLYPAGFGEPESKGIGWGRIPSLPRRPQELLKHVATQN